MRRNSDSSGRTSCERDQFMLANIPSRRGICLVFCRAAPSHAEVQPGDPIGAFEITRFEVDGNTLLNDSTVQSAVAGFAGKDRNFGYIERAIDALESAYRKHGFTLVK